MDETDMGAGMSSNSPEGSLGSAVDAAAAPQIPAQVPHQGPLEAREHFDTPDWIGPEREWHMEYAEHTVPEQPEPIHDVLPTRRDDTAVISEGHWVESAPPRILAGILFTLGLLGLIGAVVAAAITQSVVAISIAIAAAVIVVVFRGALMSSGVTTVELKSGRLTVLRDGHKDMFDLTDPAHLIEVVGTPQDSAWRLRLEHFDGRIVELTRQHVNAEELHPAVLHYRRIADQERQDRERRFNR